MKIPAQYDDKSVLIADDEPEHVEWLADYFRARGFSVSLVTNVRDAIAESESRRFRLYVIDLNIPLGGWKTVRTANVTYEGYRGLHIIQHVRTQGNPGRRVIAYSAHYNEQITAEIKLLYCEYVVKGRAKQLKDVIADILASDPVAAAVVSARPARPAIARKSPAAPRKAGNAPKRSRRPGALPPKQSRRTLSASPKKSRKKL